MKARYLVDRASLQFHVPPGLSVPPIVDAFYAWLAQREAGSLGYFSLAGDRLDDFYVEDGSRRATAFVSFLSVIDGSRIGWWRPNGESLDEAPIVLLGGEGELRALARSAEELLWKIARDETGVDDLADGDSFDELRAWLEQRGAPDRTDDAALESTTSALQRWFDEWKEARARIARTAPERVEFAKLLAGLLGLPDESWERSQADLVITGKQCALYRTMIGQDPVKVPRTFESAARAFRDADARELPEAGLWFRASVSLDADGVLAVQRNYIEEPERDEIRLDDEGLRLDAERMPRSPHWTPAWLAKRLARR